MAVDLQQTYALALEAHEQENFDRAVNLYEQIIARFPDADLVLYNQGLALYQLDRFAEAAALFAQAAEIRNDDADTWFNLGLALKQDGQYPEACRAYKQALQLQPDDADFLYNLAGCCKDMGDNEQAVSCYRQVLEKTAGDTSALNNLACLLHRQGEFCQAEKYYERLLVLRPDHPAAGYMLAALRGRTVDASPREYVRDLFDQYSDTFESSLLGELGYRTPQLLKAAFDALDGKKQMYDRCLDLGCGTGLAGGAFRSVCEELVGVDLSEGMVEKARGKKVYDRLEIADIVFWLKECQGLQFDLVIAADVLTYFGDLCPFLQAVSVRSCPEGLFCFSTEKNTDSGWKLQPTGRFAHHSDYVEETANRFDWQLLFREAVELRREGDSWIKGDIFILKRKKCLFEDRQSVT